MLTRLIASAALVGSLSGCASMFAPSTFGLDQSSAQLIRQTCDEIMGLRNGPEYQACGASLAQTVSSLQDVTRTLQADQACEQQGLVRGTVEQAKCVVMFRRSTQASTFASTEAEAVPQAQPWLSYFSMSQAQQEERIELSCAQLGLHPATGRFWQCASDLKYSIANIRFDAVP